MRTCLRIGNITGSLLAMLLACGLGACTTQESNPPGTGGTSGGGSGGTTTPTGSGGTGPVGGSTGSTATDGTMCLPVTQALITDFTYTPSDAGTPDTANARFGDSVTTFSGGTSVCTNATTPLTSDVSQNNWHISGTIENYSGFNLYFDNCSRIDASAYKGISFTISGSVGSGSLVMGMGTLNDAVAASWLISKGDTSAKETDPGRCVPTSGTNKYDQQTCADPIKQITVAASPTPVSLLWTDFTGGKPKTNVEPTDIISIYWYFVWTSGASYPVDITIDDLKFIE
jgi:hypothetical protein